MFGVYVCVCVGLERERERERADLGLCVGWVCGWVWESKRVVTVGLTEKVV